jgi:hypothetical protein
MEPKQKALTKKSLVRVFKFYLDYCLINCPLISPPGKAAE